MKANAAFIITSYNMLLDNNISEVDYACRKSEISNGVRFKSKEIQRMMDGSIQNEKNGIPIINVKGIKKAFGDVQALRGVDFELQPGEVMGLLGPNGAGKTTLIRILTTLLKPDAGEATIAGFNVQKHPQSVRSVIGLAGQYATVDEELTGMENLLMIGHLSHLDKATTQNRAGELLERFSLTDASFRIVKNYSGGMRRRLDVAASLLMKPPVLFLDEPTTGLDLRSRTEMWNIIRQFKNNGTTVLLTTQYLEEADQLADTICILDNGEIVARGTSEELKRKIRGSVLLVTIAELYQLELATKLVSSLSSQSPEIDVVLGQIKLSVGDGTVSLVDAVRKLDENKIKIVDIALQRPTLDDVFLTLTGHKTSEKITIPQKKSSLLKKIATGGKG
jgi:ABC-2 type transport system ATP-binding protein